jgi:uncharacterized protein
MLKNSITILVTLAIVAGMIFIVYSAMTRYSQVVLGGKTFVVDTARTTYSLQRGLSYRESLADDGGMFFIFSKEDKYGFWMKDMNFPIDIIWINSDMKIVHIEKSVATSTYPKVFTPEAPAKYVLEISAGQTDALKVKKGDTVIFSEK